MSDHKITRQQLESSFAKLQGDLEGTVKDKQSTLAVAGGIAAVALLVLVFLLGRRAGKKKTTIVEIRRV